MSANDADDIAITQLVQERQRLRAARQYDNADAIRHKLLAVGIVVFDAKQTTAMVSDASVPQGSPVESWLRIRTSVADEHSSHIACMSWSHRRTDFCALPRADGEWFCVKHCESLRGRVPCPCDPRHNLKPATVAQHLERCQKSPGRPALAAETLSVLRGDNSLSQQPSVASKPDMDNDGVNTSLGAGGQPVVAVNTSANDTEVNNSDVRTTLAHDLPWIVKGVNLHDTADIYPGVASASAQGPLQGEEAAQSLAVTKDFESLRVLSAKIESALSALDALAPLPNVRRNRNGQIENIIREPAPCAAVGPDDNVSSKKGRAAAKSAKVLREEETIQLQSIVGHTMDALRSLHPLQDLAHAHGQSPQNATSAENDGDTDVSHVSVSVGVRPVVCVECCAGKARLSLELDAALKNDTHFGNGATSNIDSAPAPHYVLIDRCTTRKVSDIHLRSSGADRGGSCERVTCDLADIQLDKIPAISKQLGTESNVCGDDGFGVVSDTDGSDGGDSGASGGDVGSRDTSSGYGGDALQRRAFVIHGKHVCGEAADLTIRSAKSLCAACREANCSGAKPSICVVLALCCHHLCHWETLVGQSTLLDAGITKSDFAVMRRLVTMYRAHPSLSPGGGVRAQETPAGRLACARATLGVQSKRLVNEVRAQCMRQQGWKVRLVRYIDDDISPENTLLVATFET